MEAKNQIATWHNFLPTPETSWGRLGPWRLRPRWNGGKRKEGKSGLSLPLHRGRRAHAERRSLVWRYELTQKTCMKSRGLLCFRSALKAKRTVVWRKRRVARNMCLRGTTLTSEVLLPNQGTRTPFALGDHKFVFCVQLASPSGGLCSEQWGGRFVNGIQPKAWPLLLPRVKKLPRAPISSNRQTLSTSVLFPLVAFLTECCTVVFKRATVNNPCILEPSKGEVLLRAGDCLDRNQQSSLWNGLDSKYFGPSEPYGVLQLIK